jgi:hypothetical protein
MLVNVIGDTRTGHTPLIQSDVESGGIRNRSQSSHGLCGELANLGHFL